MTCFGFIIINFRTMWFLYTFYSWLLSLYLTTALVPQQALMLCVAWCFWVETLNILSSALASWRNSNGPEIWPNEYLSSDPWHSTNPVLLAYRWPTILPTEPPEHWNLRSECCWMEMVWAQWREGSVPSTYDICRVFLWVKSQKSCAQLWPKQRAKCVHNPWDVPQIWGIFITVTS